ncbi:MAG TPA: helix-hairpin-helix domain-containing protein, partial [Spirochaetales bacterium]|nr:helix-hairpin-helix domain-containing protein [Spirochaetales bacterium]
LLLTPPIKGNRVLGIDPGIRTGTKCAALDETGKFLGYFIINQEHNFEAGKEAVAKAVKEYGIQVIAVGNGTGSSDVCRLVSEAIQEKQLNVQFTIVDEDGASVYSASEIAREEFPELDLTIRGAISIGRRLQDPLAELVKIDPKSIGVGLYQHDVNQKNLTEKLDEVVESVVNNVGVNINTASHALLKYVSGINSLLAKKIVKYRDEKGKIVSREELKNIPGLGDKTFEQCAGFLKIPESENPLDNTWVHPENYALASELYPLIKEQKEITKAMKDQLKNKYGVGETTIEDIILELKKPNRDPRDELPKPLLQTGVLVFEDLKEGMIVTGKVKNVVDFGAFVDIGIKETALVHISEISDTFVKNPLDVIKVGEVKEFRIIGLDTIRRRISLSCKSVSRLQSGQDRAQQGKADTDSSAHSAKKVVTVKRKQTEGNRMRT